MYIYIYTYTYTCTYTSTYRLYVYYIYTLWLGAGNVSKIPCHRALIERSCHRSHSLLYDRCGWWLQPKKWDKSWEYRIIIYLYNGDMTNNNGDRCHGDTYGYITNNMIWVCLQVGSTPQWTCSQFQLGKWFSIIKLERYPVFRQTNMWDTCKMIVEICNQHWLVNMMVAIIPAQ